MKELAEREGFEPPVPFGITGFQDQRLKPLGHLSMSEPARVIIAPFPFGVNHFLYFSKIIFVELQYILDSKKKEKRLESQSVIVELRTT